MVVVVGIMLESMVGEIVVGNMLEMSGEGIELM